MGGLSPAHLILILAVALIVVGPGRLPETGAALGKALREFRQAMDGKADEAAPSPAAATVAEAPAASAAEPPSQPPVA